MNMQEAIKYFGGRPQMAKACGVTKQAVHIWLQNGIPDTRQYHISYITGGRLNPDQEVLDKMGYWNTV